jgi:hypothetical protein
MADYLTQESGDKITLEDNNGALILEESGATPVTQIANTRQRAMAAALNRRAAERRRRGRRRR